MSLSFKGTNEIPSCHGGLENLDQEYQYEMKHIEGDLPKNLRGTFFRNGPGRQKIGGKKYGHWFDGDGMLCAYTFSEGRVFFKNRYVGDCIIASSNLHHSNAMASARASL